MEKTPVNVITGFLGSGKTTIIMKLLEQVDRPEDIVWLKNEYGNLNVDKKLVEQSNVQTKEIMNGCLCCVLVGRLGDAIEEIQEKFEPKRIIIESSGTAYPAPIVLELKKIDTVFVDSVITVVDVINFDGYKDMSFAAKNQAKYVDLIVFNKWPKELTSGSQAELEIEHRLDDVYALNLKTPKVKTIDGKINADLVFGINNIESFRKKFVDLTEIEVSELKHGHLDEPEVFELSFSNNKVFRKDEIDSKINSLKEKGFIRIKGIVNTSEGLQILNWIYGRATWTKLKTQEKQANITEIVFMARKPKLDEVKLTEFILSE